MHSSVTLTVLMCIVRQTVRYSSPRILDRRRSCKRTQHSCPPLAHAWWANLTTQAEEEKEEEEEARLETPRLTCAVLRPRMRPSKCARRLGRLMIPSRSRQRERGRRGERGRKREEREEEAELPSLQTCLPSSPRAWAAREADTRP
jgi:hypothetical protein